MSAPIFNHGSSDTFLLQSDRFGHLWGGELPQRLLSRFENALELTIGYVRAHKSSVVDDCDVLKMFTIFQKALWSRKL
jgi:hypothetical protein